LTLPALCFFFAVLLRFLGWLRDRSNQKATGLKVSAYLAAALGLYVGLQYLWSMFNPETGYLYMQSIPSNKVLYSHYVSAALPILTLLAFGAWALIEKRLGRPLSF